MIKKRFCIAFCALLGCALQLQAQESTNLGARRTLDGGVSTLQGEQLLRSRSRHHTVAQLPRVQVKDGETLTLANIVLFVRFADDQEINRNLSTMESFFNGSSNSVRHYYSAMSYGQLTYQTYFPSNCQTQVVSYCDIHNRGYYKPYSSTNPEGYHGDNPMVSISQREAELIARAVRYADSLHLYADNINLDGNGDGDVDNLSLVIKGNVGNWADLLWPHMEFFPHDSIGGTLTLNGKRINAFNFEFEGSGSYFSVGTFCHEMGHSLGLPDLYHYYESTMVYPAPFDMMGNFDVQSSAIYKARFLNLCDEPIRITHDGTYRIKSSGSHRDSNLYYIASSLDPDQWYLIEHRSSSDPYDGEYIYGNSLIFARLMDTASMDIYNGGNSEFSWPNSPNVYWQFRPGSNHDTVNGSMYNVPCYSGRFSQDGTYQPYLADGTPENSFELYDLQFSDGVCTFKVRFFNTDIRRPESEESQCCDVTLAPNPATRTTRVSTQGFESPVELTIYDMTGRQLRSERIGEQHQLNLQGLPHGTLLLQLTDGLHTAHRRLVVR